MLSLTHWSVLTGQIGPGIKASNAAFRARLVLATTPLQTYNLCAKGRGHQGK